MKDLSHSKPHVCFEVEKVIGVSPDGSYQVQWAPTWVSRFHLVGCEHLIQEFLQESQCDHNEDTALQQHQEDETTAITFEIPHVTRKLLQQTSLPTVDGVKGIADLGDVAEQHEYQQFNCVKRMAQTSEVDPGGGEKLESRGNSLNSVENLADMENCFQLNLAIKVEGDESYQQSEVLQESYDQNSNLPSEILHLSDAFIQLGTTTSEPKIKYEDKIELAKTMDDSSVFSTHLPRSSSFVSMTRNVSKQNTASFSSPGIASQEAVEETSEKEPFKVLCVDAKSEHGLLSCPKCNGTFRSVGGKPHTCSDCNSTIAPGTDHESVDRLTSERLLLRSPLKKPISPNKKPYECEYCTKSFSLQSLLKQHQRSHTGEKPYLCQQCGKCYSLKGTLRRHMKIHQGLRPYTCKVCSKKFSQKTHLDAHIRQHTGEKPFQCSLCGRRFTNLGVRNQHMKNCLQPQMFTC